MVGAVLQETKLVAVASGGYGGEMGMCQNGDVDVDPQKSWKHLVSLEIKVQIPPSWCFRFSG